MSETNRGQYSWLKNVIMLTTVLDTEGTTVNKADHHYPHAAYISVLSAYISEINQIKNTIKF